MKKTLLTISLLILAVSLQGQERPTEKTYKRDGKTFVQQTARKATTTAKDVATAYYWQDSKGNDYPIFLHTYVKGEKAGRTTAYVIRVSAKTGKEYKYYLPNGEEIANEIINETK